MFFIAESFIIKIIELKGLYFICFSIHNIATMSESSRKTPSPLLCLAFAMLSEYFYPVNTLVIQNITFTHGYQSTVNCDYTFHKIIFALLVMLCLKS